MTDSQTIDARAAQPRSIGTLSLAVARRDGASALSGLRQSGALKALFPTPRGPSVTAVTINTGGGVTGGDRFDLAADVGQGAALTVTTQAAERIYRAPGAVPGRVTSDLTVAAGGTLAWLPQETILFDGARLRRRLRLQMAADARALLVEPVIFGRHARGETVRAGALSDRIAIDRNGVPLLRDGCELSGDMAAQLDRAAIGGGAGAMAFVVFAAPDADCHLDALRAEMPTSAGASCPQPGLLVARLLAADGFALRQALIPALERLSGAQLPSVWRF